MSFPMQLLRGHRHAVLGVNDDQATLVVLVEGGGIEFLARELIQRCPAARLTSCSGARAVVLHSGFQVEMAPCTLGPHAVLLDVRRPPSPIGDAIVGVSKALGEYVSAVTGSPLLGSVASLGALKAIDSLAASFNPAPNGGSLGGRGRS